LNVIGLINIQFVIKNEEVFVIEVNIRASRTVPVINKVCNINMIDLAIQSIMNHDFDIPKYKIQPAMKKPIFSNSKITKETITLGPEMKSSGEELVWL
jgi:carbamoyl-phosphate synthase large subunit